VFIVVVVYFVVDSVRKLLDTALYVVHYQPFNCTLFWVYWDI